MNIYPTSCYADLSSYHEHEEQHIGYQPMRDAMLAFIRKLVADGKSDVLEFGAGTGLLTQHLMQIEGIALTTNEPDIRCREQLLSNFEIDHVSNAPFETYKAAKPHDCVISSFAHDHIQDTQQLTTSLKHNLKSGGYYVCGIELLREYHSEADRNDALKEWHGYVIDDALTHDNQHLAFLEQEALESGLNKIADFKVSKSCYEASMIEAGFTLVTHQQMSPTNTPDIGGVYFYVWLG